MARNLYAREHYHEGLEEHVGRHGFLLELVEAGDPAAVLAELAVHGERSFSDSPNSCRQDSGSQKSGSQNAEAQSKVGRRSARSS
jgi:hypothetical protein